MSKIQLENDLIIKQTNKNYFILKQKQQSNFKSTWKRTYYMYLVQCQACVKFWPYFIIINEEINVLDLLNKI